MEFFTHFVIYWIDYCKKMDFSLKIYILSLLFIYDLWCLLYLWYFYFYQQTSGDKRKVKLFSIQGNQGREEIIRMEGSEIEIIFHWLYLWSLLYFIYSFWNFSTDSNANWRLHFFSIYWSGLFMFTFVVVKWIHPFKFW